MPLILSIVGKSDTGKTTLLLRVFPELRKRGYRVAAVKHCPHGFDLDVEGKDSWKFTQAGAEGILLTSPQTMAVIKKIGTEFSPIAEMIDRFFYDFDFVLIEGLAAQSPMKTIEILRKGITEVVETPSSQLVAVVADFALDLNKPVFSPKDIDGIVNFIENLAESQKKLWVNLKINGETVPMNEFVQNLFKSTLLGMVEPLKKKAPKVEKIEITVRCTT